MSEITQITQREGNTSPRARKWVFTIHNWREEDITNITRFCSQKKWEYIFSKEMGKTGETPHLQGYLQSKDAINFDTLKKLMPNAHLEKAKGSLKQNIKYISKENLERFTNLELPYEEILEETITSFYEWQQEILDILETKPEKRIIHWVHDPEGNKGKTELCRFLFRNKKVMWIRTAKENDIKHILVETKNCRDIIFDLPRDSNKISYRLLEELKDGFIFSGKYESSCKEIAIPHIIVMSNSPPKESLLSKGRIIVHNI